MMLLDARKRYNDSFRGSVKAYCGAMVTIVEWTTQLWWSEDELGAIYAGLCTPASASSLPLRDDVHDALRPHRRPTTSRKLGETLYVLVLAKA